jgi:uncharacterized protein YjbI with pentapeptide repeats
MPSAEALNSLLAGGVAWRDYVARTSGTIDLTFADPSGKDLSSLKFERCDFTGTQLDGANFDNATIHSCTFAGTNLSKASFVRCEVRKVTARKVIAESIIVRASSLADVELTESNMSAAMITASSLENCQFTKNHGSEFVLLSSKFEKCTLIDLVLDRLRVCECEFESSEWAEWKIGELEVLKTSVRGSKIARIRTKTGSLRSSGLTACTINRLVREESGHLCHEVDLSRSTLADIDLRIVGLDTATMLETALIRCEWPKQRGRISLTGGYVASKDLLAQPVQDLKGVPPLTRRDIADAQYIVRKIETASRAGGFGIRLWGICTGFGQSVGRLSLMTFGMIVASTIGILGVRGQLIGRYLHLEYLYHAARDSFDAFFSLASIPVTDNSGELIVAILTRIGGFVALGLWVKIASNKLSKLGAE